MSNNQKKFDDETSNKADMLIDHINNSIGDPTQTSVQTVGRFEKVSFDEFKSSIENMSAYMSPTAELIAKGDSGCAYEYEEYCNITFENLRKHILDNIHDVYNNIQIPTRATKGSAGYDICVPFSFEIVDNIIYKIPTGIKVAISPGWVFKIYPRSSWSKTGTTLTNTVGIVDNDYYNNPGNEGNIGIGFTSNSGYYHNKSISFCQGIFEMFGIAENDDDTDFKTRNGGFGSTDK